VVPLIDVQYNMAKNIGADFFNLYNAMGGEDAIVRWVTSDPSLANRDYTHANHRGAKKFAELIYEAIMKEFKAYEKINNQ
jgi:lysophospholipase L1-like esterase